MIELLYLIIALAVCVSVHEASHAWVAWKLGDPTAKIEGRVSLNPLRHLDLLGTLMIFLVHFGWGKPVPFNERNLKHPRRDSALIALAGPGANLLTAMLLSVIIRYTPLPSMGVEIVRAIFSLSLVLFLFNLIPIAPLDGSKLVGLIVPEKYDYQYQQFLAKGPVILILLIVGDRLLQEISGFSILGSYLQFGYELITMGLFLII